jgi:hypothetical protein
VHVPMAKAVIARRRIDPRGSLWQSVLDNTGQPADLVGKTAQGGRSCP